MSLLVNARCEQKYEDVKSSTLAVLVGATFGRTFMDNWSNTQYEWVLYKRGDESTNNTNNRIESKWGKTKDMITDSFTIDQVLSTLITLQYYTEEQYMVEYHRVGDRSNDPCEGSELASVALQMSRFAFNLMFKQYAIATRPESDDSTEVGVPGRATVTNEKTGKFYAEHVP